MSRENQNSVAKMASAKSRIIFLQFPLVERRLKVKPQEI
jgi:hypothetical protein